MSDMDHMRALLWPTAKRQSLATIRDKLLGFEHIAERRTRRALELLHENKDPKNLRKGPKKKKPKKDKNGTKGKKGTEKGTKKEERCCELHRQTMELAAVLQIQELTLWPETSACPSTEVHTV